MDWKTLDSLIENFDSMVNSDTGFSGLFSFVSPGTSWKEVWAKAKEIQNGFKGIRYPSRQQHEDAWQLFNKLRDEASRKSECEWQERQRVSKRHNSEIMRQVESARPNSLFGLDPVNVEEMKSYGQTLREAGRMLSKYKQKMLGKDKQECFDDIQKMREIHDAWWADLKQEKNRRHEKFQDRVRNNLERNHERHCKATQALEHFQSKASELRSQISSAWNGDWAAKAEGWLAEFEDKISDIENSIDRIEEWVREDEDKLS